MALYDNKYYIVPSGITGTVASGTITDVDEGIIGGTPDGNYVYSPVDNWEGSPIIFTFSAALTNVGSLNYKPSGNFARVRKGVTATDVGGGDSVTYVSFWGNDVSSNQTISTVTQSVVADPPNMVNYTNSPGNSLNPLDTVAGMTVEFYCSGWSKSMGTDNLQLVIDGIEVELNLLPNETISAAGISSVTNNSASLNCTVASWNLVTSRVHWYVGTSATPPSATNLKNGTGAVDFGEVNPTSSSITGVSVTGLSSSTKYYVYWCWDEGTVYNGGNFSTYPVVLSAPTEGPGWNQATIGCTSTHATGTIYWYVGTSATPPSSTDLKAGTGATAYGSSAAVIDFSTSTGAVLSPETTYYSYFYQEDSPYNSNILESGSWVTVAQHTFLSYVGILTKSSSTSLNITCVNGNFTYAGAVTYYFYLSTSATPPSVSNHKDGTGASQWTSGAIPSTVAISWNSISVSAGNYYYLHTMATDTTLGDSTQSTWKVGYSDDPDFMENMKVFNVSDDSAIISGTTSRVSTLAANDRFYTYISTSATPPSLTDLINGTGAVYFHEDLAASYYACTIRRKLTANTTYYGYVVQYINGSYSNIAETGAFTTTNRGYYYKLTGWRVHTQNAPLTDTTFVQENIFRDSLAANCIFRVRYQFERVGGSGTTNTKVGLFNTNSSVRASTYNSTVGYPASGVPVAVLNQRTIGSLTRTYWNGWPTTTSTYNSSSAYTSDNTKRLTGSSYSLGEGRLIESTNTDIDTTFSVAANTCYEIEYAWSFSGSNSPPSFLYLGDLDTGEIFWADDTNDKYNKFPGAMNSEDYINFTSISAVATGSDTATFYMTEAESANETVYWAAVPDSLGPIEPADVITGYNADDFGSFACANTSHEINLTGLSALTDYTIYFTIASSASSRFWPYWIYETSFTTETGGAAPVLGATTLALNTSQSQTNNLIGLSNSNFSTSLAKTIANILSGSRTISFDTDFSENLINTKNAASTISYATSLLHSFENSISKNAAVEFVKNYSKSTLGINTGLSTLLFDLALSLQLENIKTTAGSINLLTNLSSTLSTVANKLADLNLSTILTKDCEVILVLLESLTFNLSLSDNFANILQSANELSLALDVSKTISNTKVTSGLNNYSITLSESTNLIKITTALLNIVLNLSKACDNSLSLETAISFLLNLSDTETNLKLTSSEISLITNLSENLTNNKISFASLTLDETLNIFQVALKIASQTQTFSSIFGDTLDGNTALLADLAFILNLSDTETNLKLTSSEISLITNLSKILSDNKLTNSNTNLNITVNQLQDRLRLANAYILFSNTLNKTSEGNLGNIVITGETTLGMTFAKASNNVATRAALMDANLVLSDTRDVVRLLHGATSYSLNLIANYDYLGVAIFDDPIWSLTSQEFIFVDLTNIQLVEGSIKAAAITITNHLGQSQTVGLIGNAAAEILLTLSKQQLAAKLTSGSTELFNNLSEVQTNVLNIVKQLTLSMDLTKLSSQQLDAVKTVVYNLTVNKENTNVKTTATDLTVSTTLNYLDSVALLANTSINFGTTLSEVNTIISELTAAISYLTQLSTVYDGATGNDVSIHFDTSLIKSSSPVGSILNSVLTFVTNVSDIEAATRALQETITYLLQLQEQAQNTRTSIEALSLVVNMGTSIEGTTALLAAAEFILNLAHQNNVQIDAGALFTAIVNASLTPVNSSIRSDAINYIINLQEQIQNTVETSEALELILNANYTSDATTNILGALTFAISFAQSQNVTIDTFEFMSLLLSISESSNIFRTTNAINNFNLILTQSQVNTLVKVLAATFATAYTLIPTNNIDAVALAEIALVLTENFVGDKTGQTSAYTTLGMQLFQNNLNLKQTFGNIDIETILNKLSLGGRVFDLPISIELNLADNRNIDLQRQGLVTYNTLFSKGGVTKLDGRPNISIDLTLSDLNNADKQTLATMLLGIQSQIGIQGNKVVAAITNYALNNSIDLAFNMTVEGRVIFSATLLQTEILQLLGQAGITFGNLLGLVSLGGALRDANIDYGTIVGISAQGFRIAFELVTPDGRKFKIYLEDRITIVDEEDRVIKVFGNRDYTIN